MSIGFYLYRQASQYDTYVSVYDKNLYLLSNFDFIEPSYNSATTSIPTRCSGLFLFRGKAGGS